jgi:putative nucleotidyltransferase with HDIG domain
LAWDDIPDWSLDVAKELLAPLKAKDPFTFYHCCRVGRGSRQLAKAMGLNQFEQAVLEYAGLFHDIGKTQIPTEILTKPGRLDRAEVEVMKSHAEFSVQMLQHLNHIPFFRFLIPGVRYHHERVDGAGYPHGVKGDNIPLFARLICVVDSFDAMTNNRAYRPSLPEDKAVKELLDFSGRQFDLALVRPFLELLPHLKKESEDTSDEMVVAKILKVA